METLVLSAGYEPVARITWQRAMTLVFQGKVVVEEEYEDRKVRSVTVTFKMPSVVRFIRYMRGKRKALKFSRENVYCRDKGSCQYCGDKVTRGESTYDHVTPRSQGGQTNWENIVIACMECNQSKGGRTPAQARMHLKTQPVRPKKLDDTLRISFSYRKGMPDSWRQWLGDMAYWNVALDED